MSLQIIKLLKMMIVCKIQQFVFYIFFSYFILLQCNLALHLQTGDVIMLPTV